MVRYFSQRRGHNLTQIINSNDNEWPATFANIQAAIDDLGGNPGCVWLPEMNVSGAVAAASLSAGQTLKGVGYGTHITITANNINGVEIPGTAGTHRADVKIEQLRLEGNGAGTGNGIDGAYADRISILNVWATNFGNDGIHLSDSSNFLIDSCFCYSNGNDGIYVVITDSVELGRASRNSAFSNTVDGIFVQQWHTIIDGNQTYDNGRYGIYALPGDQVIVGNACYLNVNHGIYARGAGTALTGNLVSHSDAADAIRLDGGDHSAIVGNEVNGYTNGIHVRNCDYVTVTGNECLLGATGIYIETANHVVVSSNVCVTNTNGIYVTGAEDCTIVGNDLVGGGSFGINLIANVDWASVECNRTKGNTGGCVNVGNANCDNNMLTNNQFDEGNIADAGTNTRAWLNYDPSANAFIATINAPVVVGGGGGALP